MIKIIFLGTGTSQGIPIPGSNHPVCLSNDPKDKRLRSSIMIEWDDNKYLIDCGPDFRQQMLKIKCNKIDGILFTHEHADHIRGIDDLRPYSYRQGNIQIYGTKRLIESLNKYYPYIFNLNQKYPGSPSFNINTIKKNESFYLSNKEIIPIEVMHQKLPVLGFRVDKFAYLTDVKTISSNEIKKLSNLDVLVINTLRLESHPSHLNLIEAIAIIKDINPKKTFLTHISNQLGFHKEVSKKLPENIFLAYDGMEINLK